MKNPAKGAPYIGKKPKSAKIVGQTTRKGKVFSTSAAQRRLLFGRGEPFTLVYKLKGRYLRERMNA
jgi:hypothetical protein